MARAVIARALRWAPTAVLGLLLAWAAWDVALVALPGWNVSLPTLLVVAAIGSVVGATRRGRPFRALGLAALGLAYFGAHVVALGVQIVQGLLFITLLIVQVELDVMKERFAPLYERLVSPDVGRRIDRALARALVRLGTAGTLGVLVPIFAADLALSGAVATTSIGTAILFAAAFAVVVALLALLPILERRAG